MQQTQAISSNPLAEMKQREKTARVYTLEEYLKREEASTERHEYHNGKIIKLPIAKGPHNVISANLIFGISKCIASNDTDFTVFTSNQKVYLPKLNFGLYPDALVVSREPVYWDQNQVLLTNPLLIVEVLSKRTRNYDLVKNFKFIGKCFEHYHIPQNITSSHSITTTQSVQWPPPPKPRPTS